MRKPNWSRCCLFTVLLLLLAPCSFTQETGKKKVTRQTDLPRFTYPVKESASELVQADDATFNAFASKVRTDLGSIFRDYEINDKATLRSLLRAKIGLQYLAGEYADALKTIDELREQEEKPSARLTTGVFGRAMLRAAIETKSTAGATFDEAFQKHAREALTSLPWDVVQDDIKNSYLATRVYTRSLALAQVKADLDPAVQKSGVLDNLQAWQLIDTRKDLRLFYPPRGRAGKRSSTVPCGPQGD